MIYKEVKGDLFSIKNQSETGDYDDYTFVHCIASDLAMGAGIAVPMANRFDLRYILSQYPEDYRTFPTAIYTNGVINMITKPMSSGKPRYEDFISSLREVKRIVITYEITRIALPQIGCGIDGLSWEVVSALIRDLFKDIAVEIVAVIFDPSIKGIEEIVNESN